jgi:hypothetical protein
MFVQYNHEKKWIAWSGYAMRWTIEASNGRVGMSVMQRSPLLSNDAPHRAARSLRRFLQTLGSQNA